MYNPKYNLVANPINRYSIGDQSGMKPDADGSLSIYVQKDSPGAEREANWLPAPDGQFFLILRTYLPADDIVNQTWQPPKIAAVAGRRSAASGTDRLSKLILDSRLLVARVVITEPATPIPALGAGSSKARSEKS